MPHSVTIPFFAFKLHFIGGGNTYLAMNKMEHPFLKESIKELSATYTKEFQKYVLDKGDFEKILLEYQQGDFFKSEVKVDFPSSMDGFSYPEFELEFDFFFRKNENGYWAIIPSLAIEAFAEEDEQLLPSVQSAIRQEFRKFNRLKQVHGIVSALWYDTSELLQNEISLEFYNPQELEKLVEEKKEEWLPKVARILKVDEKVTFGRAKEMNRFARALKGKFQRNILIVGASGVGKTALVEELVFQRKNQKFEGTIWETTASVLIKELTQETGWQDNIEHVVKELVLRGDVLFVRNLLELFEVGKYEGNSVSIAEYFLTYLSKGEINIISECTSEEKGIIELRSPNYLSNFQIISLGEPKEDLEGIILNKVTALSNKNKTKIATEAILETVRLNKRFTPYSGFPGKPIRFLESILINQVQDPKSTLKSEISRGEVIRYFSEDTGMPLFMVDPEIPMFPNEIRTEFNNSVFGQEVAVDRVVNMLTTVKTGLSKIGKPIASFLFVGPTGVGKTELAKVLSQFMFGSRDKMVRFDMSEYSGWDAVNKLLGSGFQSDGLLTSTVRREPFCVLLFDEIEKAHPDFFDLLLQMLSEGRLTDSRGKLVNFCSTIIIMTSNIGASAMQRRTIGPEGGNKNQELVQRYLKAVQDYFKPEIYNRIDQIIPFEPLSLETVRFVVEREIEEFRKREGIRYRKVDLTIEEEVLDYLAKTGYNSRYGARYLQRALREKLIIPLSKQMNLFDLDDQLIVKIILENEKVKIHVEADPMGIDLLFEEIEKNDYADLTGDYRRKVQRFQEGYLYTQLVSDFDILVREKELLKEKFWNEKTRGEQYTNFLNLKTEMDNCAKEIENLETKFSLACMELEAYKPEWTEDLEKWKSDFFQFKIKTLLQLNSDFKHCRFRIFGKNIEPVLKFYKELFQRKAFDFELKTIWFRPSFYNEKVERINNDGKTIIEPRNEYVLRSWNEKSNKNLIAQESSDQLCGIEFLLIGACPNLFLQKESGKQVWTFSEKEQEEYISELVKMDTPIPSNIHKKPFKDSQNVFRKLDVTSVEDKNLNIKRELGKGSFLDLLIPILDTQFELAVNLAVM